MNNIKSVFLASVLAGLLLLAALPASAGLVGWQYQQGVTIHENSGETLRDYQVLVELEGSDFPGEAQPYGDDIRFTDADGRELSCWIEEFDAGSKRAKIWVKVPEIPANGEAGITMWYGNPGAEGGSDGDAVFEFFDDFSGLSLDTDKWNQYSESNTCDLINGNLRVTNRCVLYSRNKRFSDAVIQTRISATPYKAIDNGQLFRCQENFGTDGDKRYQYQPVDTYLSLLGRFDGDDDPSHSSIYKYVNGKREILKDSISSFLYVNTDYTLETYFAGQNIIQKVDGVEKVLTSDYSFADGYVGLYFNVGNGETAYIDYFFVRQCTSPEPTVTLAPPAPATHTTLFITKSPTPHSIRQFKETTITLSIKNSGTTDATDIEIADAIHTSFDLVSGDFPNPKRYDLIRPGETRDLQYTITAKESGTFTLDPATVTYANEDGNIQEASSEPTSIKVIPSTEGSTSGTSYNPSVSTASVQLHGEKTDVVLGEDILLKLSAVNLITKPVMHVQVIIIPPSGMSVTSSAFAKSGAGQYTTTYELEPGSGKDIEVAIRSNQVGDFNVNGRIIYYFGDDIDDAEDHTLNLPIKVRAEPGAEQAESPEKSKGSSTPGFEAVLAITGLLAIYMRKRI